MVVFISKSQRPHPRIYVHGQPFVTAQMGLPGTPERRSIPPTSPEAALRQVPCSSTSPPSPRLGSSNASVDAGSTASPSASKSTRCVAGGGTFQLVPSIVQQRNNYGDNVATLWPLQVAGTGTLTDDASVTSIHFDSTLTLGLLDSDKPVVDRRNAFPALHDTQHLSGTDSFKAGEISGNIQFIATDFSKGTLHDAMVDMVWSCPGSTKSQAPLDTNYSFSLAQVGCPVEWPQRFTLEVNPVGSRLVNSDLRSAGGFIQINRYGSMLQRTIKVTQSKDFPGYDFRIRTQGLRVKGTLVSFNSDSAMLRTTEVSWHGLPLCMPGFYSIPPTEELQ